MPAFTDDDRQVEVSSARSPVSHFLTKLCAIAGGVLAVSSTMVSLTPMRQTLKPRHAYMPMIPIPLHAQRLLTPPPLMLQDAFIYYSGIFISKGSGFISGTPR